MSYLTLKDLARILKVSESTVSRALRDHPRISKATKQRVKELAEQLEYTPNQIALNLSKQRMQAIGVVVPSIAYHLYAQAISGMEAVLEQKGFSLIICQSNESYDREKRILRELTGSRIAGLIISISSATQDYEHFARIKSKKIPLVFFNRECQDIYTDRVVIDNFTAAYTATQHLLKSGCQKLAYFGGPKNVEISNKRLEGYQAAMHEHGVPEGDQITVHTEFNPLAAHRSASDLLLRTIPPDGILAFSDQFAYQIMAAAKEYKLKIPEQLSVIGFNNEPAGALLEPALSSIDQPAHQMGEIAAELLLSQILPQAKLRSTQTKVLQSKLILRGSTLSGRTTTAK